jgi:hypothetical protein
VGEVLREVVAEGTTMLVDMAVGGDIPVVAAEAIVAAAADRTTIATMGATTITETPGAAIPATLWQMLP